ncbi:bifunctional tRNA (5-methylaminomethyl-2-thiouridine)(34)-methyltransferase MnmD/FAD-dependent 5-carboxymethylaminomethyl-2-thiouridine(34) oxidoreductase MnmC [Sulfuricystis multivorans]|uniref:bifunctional tRNA (5-methylaminomethyl-2-thiouridine)(34)-methyltransferase MnmD/FAD-dependent 5-carboxymethylaminomethyl-2-thiouridine(34) oxidoreductase MnmC n=1 Tax=Sulfuricystis multivorans TaxID=2211108 RepID=UPI001559E753|nr:bifunctional tRNA (5-methylaminomethyl-2-thiouridine)(34)-methyltransferase MnmD/FAD-dependent 5-carboxymethylaminomethyl-2-thiouridine(34) oxidoreductase MnmC [Sulfuricystis multivorans]
MKPTPIVPAELAFDGNGVPYAPAFGDVYHSASGGLEQARHVFLAGNDLPARWQGRDFAILETGFGLGLNFLATWQAWRETPGCRLHYVAIEQHPFRVEDLARLHERFPTLAPLAARLRAAWPSLIPGFHRRHFAGGAITLTLVFGPAQTVLGEIAGRFDAFYLDGFSPAKNPEMWSKELCEDLAWLAAPGATLATWTVAGEVRRHLAAAGFSVERRPGFGSKREMLVGQYRGGAVPKPPSFGGQRIAVIGAGIAGLSCAERLASRGCEVTLFERREHIAAETSGNHQAVLLPALAVEATRLSSLNTIAFLYALHRLETLAATGHPPVFAPCGVFQIARDGAHAQKQARIVAERGLPGDFVQFFDADSAAQIVGMAVAGPGWWFPRAGWVAPTALAQALLAQAGEGVTLRLATPVAELHGSDGGWQLRDATGQPLWEGATVILAHAHEIRRLPQAAHLPILCFRGQTTHLPAQALPDLLRTVVCREGYLAPPHDGIASLGASFKRSRDLAPSIEEHAANLARLTSMLPTLAGRFDPTTLAGRVALRPVSPDKLPLVGALPLSTCEPRPIAHVEWPRWPGLFVATGYGARGFVWAQLMAELLASHICNEPLPIGHELTAAVDPARFAWKGRSEM